MKFGQLRKDFVSAPSQRNNDNPAVLSVLCPANKSVLHSTFDQSHNRVVPFLQEFGEFRDGGGATTGKSSDAEHQLVLLWSHPTLPCCVLTKAKKFSQGIAKPCKIADDTLNFRGTFVFGAPTGGGLRAHHNTISYRE